MTHFSPFAENRFAFLDGAAEQPQPKDETSRDDLQDQIDQLIEEGKFKEARELIAAREKEETLEEREARLRSQLNGLLRRERYGEAKAIIRELETIRVLKQLESVRNDQNLDVGEALQNMPDTTVLPALQYAVSRKIKTAFPVIIDAICKRFGDVLMTQSEISSACYWISRIDERDIADEETTRQIRMLEALLQDR